jgi:hypothetical protein
MSKFTTYQCSVCNKAKDFIKDPIRVLPNSCSLTPNCTGRLYPQGDKEISSDYYVSPERTVPTAFVKSESDDSLPLMNARYPLLNLAILGHDELPSAVELNLLVQRVDAINYRQYTYSTSQQTATIPEYVAGSPKKDTSGKNLFLSSEEISSGRVYILKDGVPVFLDNEVASIEQSLITFNQAVPAGTKVTIIVYDEQKVKSEKLIFYRNDYRRLVYGSWSDAAAVHSFEKSNGTQETRWTVYNCDAFQALRGNLKVMLTTITDEDQNVIKSSSQMDEAFFVASSQPHNTIDRILDFIVPCSNLSAEFNLNFSSSPTTIFSVGRKSAKEVYPPLVVKPDFIMQSLSSVIDSRIPVNDISLNIFKSSKILNR